MNGRPQVTRRARALWLVAGALTAPFAVWAQDSFGPAPSRQAPPPAAEREQRSHDAAPNGALRSPAPQRADDAAETQDFGIAPTSQLRPTNQLHAPTPTTIPGGRVVGTRQLAQWLREQPGKWLLLHAIGGPRHLPQAIAVAPASQGGSFDDQVQRDFGQYLQQATGGDRSRPMVVYCAGVQCWGSYNAALRAIRMGYRNVYWYRGGIEAWERAGLEMLTASGSNSGNSEPSRARR